MIIAGVSISSLTGDHGTVDEAKNTVSDIEHASITEEEWNDPDFRAACRKYRALQESNRYVRLLKSAELVTDKITDYFNNVDLEERDE